MSRHYITSKRIPLDEATLRYYVPSIYADHGRDGLSPRYAYVSTARVLEGLQAEGFHVFSAQQSRVRESERQSYAQHLLRLRHASTSEDWGKEGIPEIVLYNSHDGTSAYRLTAGFYRLVCSNGLIAYRPEEEVRIRHSGDVIEKVITASYQVLGYTQSFTERIRGYKMITLDRQQQVEFARKALALRWRDEAPVEAEQLLGIRRSEDEGSSLWTVLNRVQENLIRGGLGWNSRTNRPLSIRAIHGIDATLTINQGLWKLADELAVTA